MRSLSSTKKPFLHILALCWCFIAGAAFAAPIDPDLGETSGSIPHLNAGANAWEPFSSNQGAPTKGGLTVVYTPQDPGDFIAFPIQGGGATVTLRPSAGGAVLPCSQVMAEPSITTATVGQCFYRINFDRVHVYYLGQLAVGDDIRLTINGLAPTAGLGVFQPFDSNVPVPGQAPVPEAGRMPARIGLVIDKSGSMGWSSHPLDLADDGVTPCSNHGAPPPGCGPTRWEVLSRAVDSLLALADAFLLPGDEITVAPFSSSVVPQAVPLSPLDHTAITSIGNLVDLGGGILSPGGGTSVGAGLEFVEPSVMPVEPDTRNQYVVLFTDGDQNIAPYVVFNDDQVRINQTQNDPVIGGPVKDFAADGDPNTTDVQLCPFALRSDNPGDSLGTQFNDDIATRRCLGHSLTTVSVDPGEPELIQYFLEILSSALIGDKLEVAAVRQGQVSQAKGYGEESFFISRRDVAFTVLLAWNERFNGIAEAWLEKDGVVFPAAQNRIHGRVFEAETTLAVTLREPYCSRGKCVDPEGEWKLFFKPFFEVGKTFTYNAVLTADNALVASRFSAEQPRPGVGETLILEAHLQEGGQPITGLPEGSVRAIVKRPEKSLGTVLGRAEVKPTRPQEGDQVGPAGLKAAAMLKDPNHREALLATLLHGNLEVVKLHEAEPGVYRAKYTDTVAEGAYALEFLVDGETAENGRITRTFTFTRYVPVVPDPEATWSTAEIREVDCPRPPRGISYPAGCFELRLTPIDRSKNLLGPGKTNLFSVPERAGWMLAPARDHLDGSYTVRLAPRKKGQPLIVKIGDVLVSRPTKYGTKR